MIKGLITALILGSLYGFALLMFKVLPRRERKGAAAGLILLGIVMMLTNLPYSWGLLNQNDTAAIIFISLGLSGGYFALAGVFLLRMSRECDEVSTDYESASVFNPTWIYLSALVSLTLVTVLFLFVIPELDQARIAREESAARTKSFFEVQETQRSLNSKKKIAVSETLDDALRNLNSEQEEEQKLAFEYLTKKENYDPKRKDEVCEALLKNPGDSVATLRCWAGPELVPRLKQEFENPVSRRQRKVLFEMYLELAGAEVAPILIDRLGESYSVKTKPLLERIGPEIEGLLIPHLNSPNFTKRIAARDLLDQWGTEGNLLALQCLKDLDLQNTNSQVAAVQFLVRCTDELDAEIKTKIGERMKGLYLNESSVGRETIFDIWSKYPASDMPAFLYERLKKSKKSYSDVLIVEMISRFDSETALEAMLFSYFNSRGNSKVSGNYLRKKGSPALAEKMVDYFDEATKGSLFKRVGLIEQMEGGKKALIEKCGQYLESDDVEVVTKGLYILATCKYDPAYESTVAALLTKPSNRWKFPLTTNY